MYNYVYMRYHEILAVDDVPSTPGFCLGGSLHRTSALNVFFPIPAKPRMSG